MSDFFANLAARAQVGEPPIRPRRTGRFEPVLPTAQLAEMTIETDTAAISPSPETRSSTTTEPAPTRDWPGATKAPVTVPDKAPTLVSDPVVRPRPVAGVHHPTSQKDAPAMLERIAAADHPTPTSLNIPTPPRSQVRAAAVDEPLVRSMQSNTGATPIVQAALPATAPTSIPAVSVAPNLLPSRTNLTAEVPTRRRERNGMPDRPSKPSEEPETVVHVSIGRIELRVPNPPARNREKPYSPVTPLSEYLRQRAAKAKS